MERKSGRRYTEEFKREAVALVERGEQPTSAIAADLGLSKDTLYGWVSKSRSGAGSRPARTSSSDIERDNIRLRKEVAVLKMERDILKKATAFFAKESK